ncbi:PadR family transcriptional regulator [Nonomuraea sp. NPDC050227]|uniref:PadR family transcriptional regulator n=1 Tax=Nonomuraea sp. NPDC050227 TaxID=3364360 RepID=UPI0037931F55
MLRSSGERVRLRAGTLYAALDRLHAEGLVAADREEVVDGRARRYYRLTSDGELRAGSTSPPSSCPSRCCSARSREPPRSERRPGSRPSRARSAGRPAAAVVDGRVRRRRGRRCCWGCWRPWCWA